MESRVWQLPQIHARLLRSGRCHLSSSPLPQHLQPVDLCYSLLSCVLSVSEASAWQNGRTRYRARVLRQLYELHSCQPFEASENEGKAGVWSPARVCRTERSSRHVHSSCQQVSVAALSITALVRQFSPIKSLAFTRPNSHFRNAASILARQDLKELLKFTGGDYSSLASLQKELVKFESFPIAVPSSSSLSSRTLSHRWVDIVVLP